MLKVKKIDGKDVDFQAFQWFPGQKLPNVIQKEGESYFVEDVAVSLVELIETRNIRSFLVNSIGEEIEIKAGDWIVYTDNGPIIVDNSKIFACI